MLQRSTGNIVFAESPCSDNIITKSCDNPVEELVYAVYSDIINSDIIYW